MADVNEEDTDAARELSELSELAPLRACIFKAFKKAKNQEVQKDRRC